MCFDPEKINIENGIVTEVSPPALVLSDFAVIENQLQNNANGGSAATENPNQAQQPNGGPANEKPNQHQQPHERNDE